MVRLIRPPPWAYGEPLVSCSAHLDQGSCSRWSSIPHRCPVWRWLQHRLSPNGAAEPEISAENLSADCRQAVEQAADRWRSAAVKAPSLRNITTALQPSELLLWLQAFEHAAALPTSRRSSAASVDLKLLAEEFPKHLGILEHLLRGLPQEHRPVAITVARSIDGFIPVETVKTNRNGGPLR